MIAVLIYMISGLLLSFSLLRGRHLSIRLWLGLVFGTVLMMWLPCLFAFFFGFTMKAQLFALAAALILPALVLLPEKKPLSLRPSQDENRAYWIDRKSVV